MPVTLEEAQIYDPYEAYLSQVIDDRFNYNRLHDKLAALPDNLLDFVFSPEPAEFVKNRIAVLLKEEQTREVAKIILEIVFADLYLGSIIEAVKERVDTDDQKTKTIAGLIVTELFGPILEELKKMHIEKFAKNMPLQPQRQDDDRIIDLKNNL